VENHRKQVAKVIQSVKGFYAAKQRIRIYHGNSNSTRLPEFEARKFVDTSQLNHVIEVNTKEEYVLVEPSVPMDALVDATLAHGLVPLVVMEFPGITVGGGIQGGAAESSSFRHGGFHETALEYEIVLGDGSLVTASRTENPDLFWGVACTYGSLGIITLVKLQLRKAAPYVKLTYTRITGHEQAVQLLKHEAKVNKVDYIDGILFDQKTGVIMTGTLTTDCTGPIATFMGPRDEWFYLHARKVIHSADSYEEYIPIKDYLFRYDRGAFWVGRLAFAYLKLPFTKHTRHLLDRQMHTRYLYRVVHKTDLSQRYIVQDIFMPARNVLRFLDYIRTKLNIYPLWLLPIQSTGDSSDVFGLNLPVDDVVMNVGVWGKAPTRSFDEFAALNRDIEQEVVRLQGRKTLYAHSYYTENQFWQIYDRQHYIALRKRYHAETIFDDIYHKVTVTHAYKASVPKAVISHYVRRLRAKH
jgi:delta24-sterol reductase